MEYPIIDTRDKTQIKEQIQALAPLYVPEWNISQDTADFGDALVDVFVQMFADTVDNLNTLPYSNYIHFLNSIRVKLLPGTSASGFVTVVLNEGIEPGVHVKKGTQLYVDQGGEGGQILYETQHDFFAVDNQINQIFSVNSYENSIVKPYDSKANPDKRVRLFDDKGYENLQRHTLYISSPDVLTIRQGAQVDIELKHRARKLQEMDMAAQLANSSGFRWSVFTTDGWEEVTQVTSVGNRISLTIDKIISELPYHDLDGRWLRCEFIPSADLPEILVEELRIGAKADELQPEILVNNDLQLHSYNILPFGENFSIYDDFYIGCEEALTKKGAHIQITFHLAFKLFQPPHMVDEDGVNWKLVMKEENFKKKAPYEITIEEVVWEYWNGNGWARLLFDENIQAIFQPHEEDIQKVQFSFICPEDTESSYIDAHHNYWIRARILKVNNAYKQNALYRSPFIETLSIAYNYRAETRLIETVLLERNVTTTAIGFDQSEKAIFQKQEPLGIATYFCLEKPLLGGPITIYFGIDQQQGQTALPLRWEYMGDKNGRLQWLELKVLDQTNMMSQSGLVMIIGKKNAVKATFFGHEGYWLRLTYRGDESTKIAKTDIPELTGFYFNTVKIKQQETHPIEYFSIGEHEPHKVCNLIGENLVDLEVWVDEQDKVSVQEWRRLQEEGKYETNKELDDTGRIVRRWVKWHRIEDVVLAEPEERCYIADDYNGTVSFGSGKDGKIPPAGAEETIKIIYKTGKGEYGNQEAESIKSFADAVPFVNEIYNVDPVIGGTSKETMENALERGPSLIKNRNTPVTIEDYINLVKQADRNIVKVRCLTHQNPEGHKQVGAITIAILPLFFNRHFSYFAAIKKNVLASIGAEGPSVVIHSNKLYIQEVTYLEINVEAKLVIDDYNDYHTVIQRVEQRLCSFIDPVTGNYDGKGWDIGQYPNREKLYHMMKQEEKIRRIDAINVTASIMILDEKQPVDLSGKGMFSLCVPVCGDMIIDIEVDAGL